MAFSFGFGSGSSFSLGSSNHKNEDRRIMRKPKTRSGQRRTSSSTTPSFNFGSSLSSSTSAAPPLFSASSSPSFSDLIIDTNRTQSPESHNKVCSSALDSAPQTATVPVSLHNGNHTAALNSSTATVSASISTSKVPVEAHNNQTNDSRKKVSASAPDSAPQFSILPVITLKLMIDKKTNRVVFSESDKDFIDLLFSFLTLPVGTIMRLLEDKSPPTVIGCMNQLYTSVKNLDTQLFITEACKKMLLQLTRLPEVHCNSLKAVIENNLEPSKCFYVCSNSDCLTAGKGVLSDFPNVRCHCGQVMNRLATLMETNSQKGNGGFVKRGVERFLVSDDLKVMPGLTSLTLMLLKDLNIVDANGLESHSLNLGQIEVTV
ncbi:hypothetical protein Vadar_023548 [Vaccinium darrowii]|uniref:Uncharacterized protein n=1 Tax=Vaccinium darrowii TaxID=229202 RepID=A0ACB7YPG6_9ERIC|nr:hypothetical protein Vadar_023548 [Vaccinium darrowii]